MTFQLLAYPDVTEQILMESAKLFTNHYGVWGLKHADASKHGQRVSMTTKQLRGGYMSDENCFMVRVVINGTETLIGHVFGRRFTMPALSTFHSGATTVNGIWFTQLVVHKDHRGQKLARKLISVCIESNVSVYGLVSSHPIAVRALEGATSLKCYHTLISQYASQVCSATEVPYLQEPQRGEFHFDHGRCVLSNQFFVDHTKVNELLQGMKNWQLGPLKDGEEFVAIIFRGLTPTPRELLSNIFPSGHSKSFFASLPSLSPSLFLTHTLHLSWLSHEERQQIVDELLKQKGDCLLSSNILSAMKRCQDLHCGVLRLVIRWTPTLQASAEFAFNLTGPRSLQMSDKKRSGESVSISRQFTVLQAICGNHN